MKEGKEVESPLREGSFFKHKTLKDKDGKLVYPRLRSSRGIPYISSCRKEGETDIRPSSYYFEILCADKKTQERCMIQ